MLRAARPGRVACVLLFLVSFNVPALHPACSDAADFIEPAEPAEAWILRHYDCTYDQRLGLQVVLREGGDHPLPADILKTEQDVHLFFDRFGQSLLASPPHAFPHRTYVIHVVYPYDFSDPGRLSYGIIQTKGMIDDRLQVFASQSSPTVKFTDGAGKAGAFSWTERMLRLRASNTDVEFEIWKRVTTDKDEQSIVATHVVPVSRTYHVSFTIGYMRTQLANPAYKYVASSPSSGTVQVTDAGDRGGAMGMVIFYASPVVWIEELFGGDPPGFRRYGRNFLDDHRLWERVFFAAGVGVNDTDFKNLLYGLTFEPFRGASFFAGGHFGEVNSFDRGGLTGGLTSADFSARLGKEWKSAWAFGLSVDLLVAKNMFSSSLN